jgi:ferredoxin-type protein NapG
MMRPHAARGCLRCCPGSRSTGRRRGRADRATRAAPRARSTPPPTARARATSTGPSRPSCCTSATSACTASSPAGTGRCRPAGSTLKPPPGATPGRWPEQAADHRRRRAGRHRRRRQGHGVSSAAGSRRRRAARPDFDRLRRFARFRRRLPDVRGHRNTIENLVIDDCLFGIDLKQSNDNVVRGNRIPPSRFDLGVRGDGLRLWYSHRNRIEDNEVDRFARHGGLVLERQRLPRNNLGRRSRYSIHFMFANRQSGGGNRFYDNAVGVYLMYTEGVGVRNNLISHATGATGMGIGFKEASDAVIEGNEIIYCASASAPTCRPSSPTPRSIPRQPHRLQRHRHAVHLRAGRQRLHRQRLRGQPHPRAQAGRNSGGLNEWRGNYWDDYQGFDRDGDNVGDTPTSCTPTPTASGWRSRRRASSRPRRRWNCSISSSAWRPSPRRTSCCATRSRASASQKGRPHEPRRKTGRPPAVPGRKAARPGSQAAALARSRRRKLRRKFLRTVLLTGGVLGAGLSGFLPLAMRAAPRLRPPGALDEKDFLASCIKCGQCVQVCPVEAIKLADLVDGFGVGAPYIDAREQACDFSCDAVQCILACPTGSLTYHKPDFLEGAPARRSPPSRSCSPRKNDPEPTLNLTERMGVARLTRPESAWPSRARASRARRAVHTFRGKMRYMRIDRWKPVPIADHALRRRGVRPVRARVPDQGRHLHRDGVRAGRQQRKSPVVHEPCVGCGVCEMICPTEPGSIEIVPAGGVESMTPHSEKAFPRADPGDVRPRAEEARGDQRAGAADPPLKRMATRRSCRPRKRTPRRT